MSGISLDQSIPICGALAALGGVLEVFATAALAYPAARSAQGYDWTDAQLKCCLATNLIFQILASLAGNLFSTWFGPVAIVGPIFFAAQLLANLVVFWIVLGLEAFSREMQIGTYVIVVSVVLLIINGPTSQDYKGTTFPDLITEFYAMIWGIILVGGMLMSGVILTVTNLHEKPIWFKISVLLVARATGFALNLSTGKALMLPNTRSWLAINIVIKIVSGIIYTRAIIVQSTAVEQKVFVPINAATIVFVNALTGIIIWEDWRVVNNWVGYVCVFLLLALGCGLLLSDLGLLQESAPETFLAARVSFVMKENRHDLLERIKTFGRNDEAFQSRMSKLETIQDDDDEDGTERGTFRRHTMLGVEHDATNEITPTSPVRQVQSIDPRGRARRRSTFIHPRTSETRNAWLSVYEGAGATSTRMSHMRHGMTGGDWRSNSGLQNYNSPSSGNGTPPSRLRHQFDLPLPLDDPIIRSGASSPTNEPATKTSFDHDPTNGNDNHKHQLGDENMEVPLVDRTVKNLPVDPDDPESEVQSSNVDRVLQTKVIEESDSDDSATDDP